MIEWTHRVPNDGLIRYYIVGNLERVLLEQERRIGLCKLPAQMGGGFQTDYPTTDSSCILTNSTHTQEIVEFINFFPF
ncbi:uncharacterized protein P174DRAFT_14197 [Aspergillus novofumigatus IBT 16806]|uniref:Uncharacterized protein n=1 Tax=Aspergillus novofumigatus (strain IBT 16806) TaxID=1392255 RepID=A0A2I1CL84_ASPN1|nr:uncharacterized protein P174DRAFT_14197 [Aspergillus novofumigatus IBT 16806]PKX98356.1 hypothetical protein P174DRAFT_14197 [Aspergillus novofumigatus IBT 16806]